MGGSEVADKMNSIYQIIAGLAAGLIGGMGLGGGTVLLIYLNLFTQNSQLTAQGINLIFFVPVGLTAVIIYAIKKKIKPKMLLLALPFGVAGSLLGSYITNFFNENILRTVFAVFLIFLGLKELFTKRAKK